MLITKAEYVVALESGTSKHVIATSVMDVCKELEADDKIVSITKDHIVEQYEAPEQVMVNTAVDKLVAMECGCKVFPEKAVLMDINSTIVLTAKASEGWHFVAWLQGDKVISNEAQAVATVESAEGYSVVNYTAVFEPDSI